MVSMKKLFSVTIAIFVLCSISSAQDVEYNFGISVGYSSSLPNYDHGLKSGYFMDQANSHNHFNVMALLEFYSNSHLRFQTGLKYYKLTFEYDFNYRRSTVHIIAPATPTSANFSYLAIPIDVNYYQPFVSNVYLSAGFEGITLLSGNTYTYNDEIKANNGYTDLFFMYTLGIGYEYQLDMTKLFIEGKYSHHIGDTVDQILNTSSIIIEQISVNIGVKI